jgi:hypothetical protein
MLIIFAITHTLIFIFDADVLISHYAITPVTLIDAFDDG